MFLKKSEGKRIRVLDTCGANWLIKGKEYKILKVYSSQKVYLENTEGSWTANEKAYEYVNNKKESFVKGDNVVVVRDTTSLKKGQITKVIDLMDEKGNRIIVEGILPGGWVKPACITKVIDLSKTRIKEAVELLEEFGTGFLEILGLPNSIAPYLGKYLSNYDVTQEEDYLVLKNSESHIVISDEMYTQNPYIPSDVYIINNCYDYLLKTIGGSTSPYTKEDYKSISGLSLSKLKKGFDSQNSGQVIGMCAEFNARGYTRLSLKNDMAVGYHIMEIKKIQQNEEAQVSIPF